MAKLRSKKEETFDPDRGPVFSARFAVALVLILGGIAWIAYYYIGVRPPVDDNGIVGQGHRSAVHARPRRLELHDRLRCVLPRPLGERPPQHAAGPRPRRRGRMLGCFLLGLAWICVFYAIAQDTGKLPIFNDLEQKNLIVGVAFMAVGFTFATRWDDDATTHTDPSVVVTAAKRPPYTSDVSAVTPHANAGMT